MASIDSTGWDGRVYTLCHYGTIVPVKQSARVVAKGGEVWRLEGGRAPHKPGSEGKVWVGRPTGAGQAQFYPIVFGLKWVVLSPVTA